ncbi:MAG: prephenate dehydrogenase [Candidatus Margulisiibacteriota bacterium]
MDTVAIIGMGLIGGSLGMAIKNKGIAKKVIGVSRNAEHLKEALSKEALDEFTLDPIEASRDADLVFICTPISTIVPMIKTIFSTVKKGCIITDVASSKADIVLEAEKTVSPEVFFVGGHPMAGSERSGIKAATKYLLEGTNYILAKTEKTSEAALKKLGDFLEKLDVELSIMSPEKHDLAVAAISHMPLAVAVSLVNAIDSLDKEKNACLKLASSGFRDTTRIASGNVEMGKDMFTTNGKAVLEMIGVFKRSLEHLEELIKKGDAAAISSELERAKDLRDGIYGS